MVSTEIRLSNFLGTIRHISAKTHLENIMTSFRITQNVFINISQSHLTGVYFCISVFLIRYALIAKVVRIFLCVHVGIIEYCSVSLFSLRKVENSIQYLPPLTRMSKTQLQACWPQSNFLSQKKKNKKNICNLPMYLLFQIQIIIFISLAYIWRKKVI